MTKQTSSMHVATIRRKYKDRVYETHLVRHSYREDGKAKHKTLANLTALPNEVVDLVRRCLRGERFFGSTELEIRSSRSHGHVALVRGVMKDIGLVRALSSSRRRERDLVEALIVARILAPQTKLATTRWWLTTTLAEECEVEDATEDDLYAVLDWLDVQQPAIERRMARKSLEEGALVLYDMSASAYTGRTCPLARFGHDKERRGLPQIAFGVLTDREGCPVAVDVYPGNTSDTTTVLDQVDKLQNRLGIKHLIFVGDRGMIKQTRVEELRQLEGVDWVGALNAGQIRKLVDSGELQLGLFDERNLMEITSQDYPGERLVVCRNPLVAAERTRKREELLAATEAKLRKIEAAVLAGRLKDPAKIAERLGRTWGRHKMRKHFLYEVSEGHFAFRRDRERIAKEAAVDGFYVVRTSLSDAQAHPTEEVVRYYKALSGVEQLFRTLKTTQVLVRPIHHRLEQRVRAHIFLCVLAAHVVWHLQQRLGTLLFRDTDRQELNRTADPVAKKGPTPEGSRKKYDQTSEDDYPLHSLRTLLAEMGTLTRNTMALPAAGTPSWEQLAVPSQYQRRVFEAAGVRLA